jgi:hypothetical protein
MISRTNRALPEQLGAVCQWVGRVVAIVTACASVGYVWVLMRLIFRDASGSTALGFPAPDRIKAVLADIEVAALLCCGGCLAVALRLLSVYLPFRMRWSSGPVPPTAPTSRGR